MKNSIVIIFMLCFTAPMFSCRSNDHPAPDIKQEQEEQPDEDQTRLSVAQMKSIGIETGIIENKQLTASLKANGVLQVPNQNKASVHSVYGGVVRSLLVQPGNTVKKGQVIVTVGNPEFIQIQDEYLGINSKIILAEQESNRQKELNEGNAGALKNLQTAENTLRTLRTRRSSLQQQIGLMGLDASSLNDGQLVSVLSIRSPISGVVSGVAVKMGSYVDVSTVIAEIVDNSQLHVDLFIYEKDMSKLRNNQTIHFTVTNNPGKEYDADIYSLGSSFEGVSKAVSVHAKVKGDKTGLIDGMNITAVISLQKATVPAVPTEAIVTVLGQDYIFIVGEESANEVEFKRIPVARGVTDIGYTEVTLIKKIPEGSKIVTKGAFFVLAKMTNTGEGD